jgi:hypothetical protein
MHNKQESEQKMFCALTISYFITSRCLFLQLFTSTTAARKIQNAAAPKFILSPCPIDAQQCPSNKQRCRKDAHCMHALDFLRGIVIESAEILNLKSRRGAGAPSRLK